MQAYQNMLRDLVVEHNYKSIRKIYLKNQYSRYKMNCTTHQQKNCMEKKTFSYTAFPIYSTIYSIDLSGFFKKNTNLF